MGFVKMSAIADTSTSTGKSRLFHVSSRRARWGGGGIVVTDSW
jgi:hypothetical protein